ncbi:hypothetical protein L2E82_32824 [Cichorium intybus]|uniref:Uncharacterized protein n=1 Tax=Cichorium intybus TaxID=13427 RepID=A0ACB9BHY2_CICIN|nr:hypothetical protein L2E82_32824 [Cichorium intybus]
MSIDPVFETLTPWRIDIFTIPNPVKHSCHLRTSRIRVAVLDSPVAVDDNGLPKVAAMIVPDQRETDWNFCTNTGHRELLSDYPSLSRLILIGNDLPRNPQPCNYIRSPDTDTDDRKKLEDELQPLVISLHPKACLQNGLPKTLFVMYEDDLLYRKIVARFVGPFVGEFVVEDVLLESDDDSADEKLRRRLRFKRMPNLIQSEVLLYPKIDGEIVTAVLNLEIFMKMKNAKFYVDTTVLVHPDLTPMVSGLSLIASHLNERIQQGFTPRALCLGVGGGSLLSFLNTELGFEVTGVEVDGVVLTAATHHFGLHRSDSIRLIVEDAIEVIQQLATRGDTDDSDSQDWLDGRYDVVMVDLDPNDARYGHISPPPEFVKQSVFEAVRFLLDDHGVLIMNVVTLGDVLYTTLIQELKDVFHKVHGVDVEGEEHYVVMATVSPPTPLNVDDVNDFYEKLRSVIPEESIESMIEM